MAHHPRIEEVSDSEPDSDPEEMDPSDFLPDNLVLRAKEPAMAPQTASTPQHTPATAAQSILNPNLVPRPAPPPSAAVQAEMKRWASIYPVYFDAGRSRAEGRRVGKELAVENPLAREIAEATLSLGLGTVLERGKMHPKDWANPGRVKVNMKGRTGVVKNSKPSGRL
jgi:signal recognition particle subunit SRP19